MDAVLLYLPARKQLFACSQTVIWLQANVTTEHRLSLKVCYMVPRRVLYGPSSNALFQQLSRIGGHGTVLRADEGRDLDGGAVGFGDRLAVEDAAHERAGERVAGADCVGHLYLRRRLE